MSHPTARSGPGRPHRTGPGGGRLGTVALVAGLVLAGLVTTWGLTASRGVAGSVPAGWVDAGATHLRVERAVARDTGHTMPGMDQSLAHPVPEGLRRLGVTVTVAATEPDGVQLRDEDFRISGPGVPATPPTRAQLGDGALAEGAATTVELAFDVPDSTDAGLVLTYGDASVPLPALGPVPSDEPHDEPPGVPDGTEPRPGDGHDH